MAKHKAEAEEGWFEEYEGQLAIDVYQTNESVVVKAPIAGVRPTDLEISITDDVVTVRGKRHAEAGISQGDFFCQECYWGTFSRTYKRPIPVDADQAQASLKDGILTINIPKQDKAKTRVLKVSPG